MTEEKEGHNAKDNELYYYMGLQAYQDNGGVPPEGWKVLENSVSLGIGKDTGYYGVAYQNIEHHEQIVIAHQGTELDDAKDVLTADRHILFHDVPTAQYKDAMTFASKISELGEVPVNSIGQTGHSLGGNLASLVAISTNGQANTFNAPGEKEQLAQLETLNGVPVGTYQNADYSDKIFTHPTEGDAVSNHGGHVGTIEPIENPFLQSQIENQEQLHDISSKLLENFPHDDTRPIHELPDMLVATQVAMDTVDNHSAAYGHALMQDMTAQDRMGPIYGPPTTEQTPDHTPSKAEWASGNAFSSLSEQFANETPPVISIPHPTDHIPSKAEWADGTGFNIPTNETPPVPVSSVETPVQPIPSNESTHELVQQSSWVNSLSPSTVSNNQDSGRSSWAEQVSSTHNSEHSGSPAHNSWVDSVTHNSNANQSHTSNVSQDSTSSHDSGHSNNSNTEQSHASNVSQDSNSHDSGTSI